MIHGVTVFALRSTITMRELLLLPDVRMLWLESVANRRPPCARFSKPMSIAGPSA